jgi:hypothetical protein
MIKISEKTIGKITVIVLADKKSNYYLSESNDIKIIDEDFMLHQISMLKSAKKTGVFTIKMQSISNNLKDKLIKKDNDFIMKNAKKIKSGGIFTMLKNKGY